MNLETLAERILKQVRTVPGLNAGLGDGNPLQNFPAAILWTPDITYYRNGSMGSSGSTAALQWPLWLLVGPANPGTVPLSLHRFASSEGDRSIFAAFAPPAGEAIQTLDGLVDHALVQSFRSLKYEEVMGIGAWGGEFLIETHVRRSAS